MVSRRGVGEAWVGLLLSLAACSSGTSPLDPGAPPDVLEPPATCGDQRRDVTEVCDGLDLDSRTCASFGFAGGTLACRDGCTGFLVGGCTGIPSWAPGLREVPAPGAPCCPERAPLHGLDLEVRFVRATATVMSAEGAPVAGQLRLRDSRGRLSAWLDVRDGAVDAEVPADDYRVVWRARDGERAWAFAGTWTPADGDRIALRLPPVHPVSLLAREGGEQRAPTPRPLRLVREGEVTAVPDGGALELFEGTYALEARLEDWAWTRLDPTLVVDQPITRALTVTYTQVVGRVRGPEGDSPPEATRLEVDGAQVPLDAEGGFAVHVLTSTGHRFHATPGGRITRLEAGGPPRQTLDLPLLPGATARLRGRLRGTTAGTLHLTHTSDARLEPLRWPIALDASGSFDVLLPPGMWTAWVDADDVRRALELATLELSAARATEVELVVPPPVWIEVHGEVTVNGQPLPDSSNGVSRGWLTFHAPALGASAAVALSAAGPATYAARLPAGAYEIAFRVPGPNDVGDPYPDATSPGTARVDPGAVLDRSHRRDLDVRMARATIRLREGGRALRSAGIASFDAHLEAGSILVPLPFRDGGPPEVEVAVLPDAYWATTFGFAEPDTLASVRAPVRVEDDAVIDLDTGLRDVSGRVRWTGVAAPPPQDVQLTWGDGLSRLPLGPAGEFSGIVAGDTARVHWRPWTVDVR